MLVNVHIYPSDFVHESRMLRETKEVLDGGVADAVMVVGTYRPGLLRHERLKDNYQVHRLPTIVPRTSTTRIIKLVSHLEWTLRVLLLLFRQRADIVTCHSLIVLPIGVLLRRFKGSALVYSPHELETETRVSPIPRPLAKRMERQLIRRADTVIVVGNHIAEWYRDEYGLDDVYIVRNIPYLTPLPETQPSILKDKLAIPKGELVFLYQGMFTTGRSVELLLSAFTHVSSDRHLVFLGYGPLTEIVEKAAMSNDNIHYLAAVPPEVLAGYTAGADVGLSLIENVSLSYYFSLPNKIFEYVHSGVPVIASNFPEMSLLVQTFECGWLTEVDEASVVALVNGLSVEDIREQAGGAVLARDALDWAEDRDNLLAGYRRGLQSRKSVTA